MTILYGADALPQTDLGSSTFVLGRTRTFNIHLFVLRNNKIILKSILNLIIIETLYIVVYDQKKLQKDVLPRWKSENKPSQCTRNAVVLQCTLDVPLSSTMSQLCTHFHQYFFICVNKHEVV